MKELSTELTLIINTLLHLVTSHEQLQEAVPVRTYKRSHTCRRSKGNNIKPRAIKAVSMSARFRVSQVKTFI